MLVTFALAARCDCAQAKGRLAVPSGNGKSTFLVQFRGLREKGEEIESGLLRDLLSGCVGIANLQDPRLGEHFAFRFLTM